MEVRSIDVAFAARTIAIAAAISFSESFVPNSAARAGESRSLADYLENFDSGYLDFRLDWDTNGGEDRYASFYRVDRLSRGFLVRDRASYCSGAPRNYFYEQVEQIIKPFDLNGFWDPYNECWIGRLGWSRVGGWDANEGHDWRFSIELQEGALMAALLRDSDLMSRQLKSEFLYMHQFISSQGRVADLSLEIDDYEYGLVLSALALGIRFLDERGDDELHSMVAGDLGRVFLYIAEGYPALSFPGEGMAVVLRGLVNAYHAFWTTGDFFKMQRCMQLIESCASRLLSCQGRSGSFNVNDRFMHVQKQLKIDIALLMASEITKRKDWIEAARTNIDWVIENRWDSSAKRFGGIMWAADDLDSYFECHQMWFLIAAALLESHGLHAYTPYKEDAFAFLTDDNFAGVDMFVHNAQRYNAFFSFRAISRDGTIQKAGFHQWKGAYEIGASLWALSLNYHAYTLGHSWLVTQAPEDQSTGWEHAIFSTRDFGGGAWIIRWDAKFLDTRYAGAYTGLFSDKAGDWRILLDTTTGLSYRDIGDTTRVLVDRRALRSNAVYTVTVSKEGKYAASVRLEEDGVQIFETAIENIKPFYSCHFGALQYNAGQFSAKNIYIDNLEVTHAVESPLPMAHLHCYPNPFVDRTCFEYGIGSKGRVRVAIFDAAGRLVREIAKDEAGPGVYQLFWDGTNGSGERVASGIYFCRIDVPGFRKHLKVIRLR